LRGRRSRPSAAPSLAGVRCSRGSRPPDVRTSATSSRANSAADALEHLSEKDREAITLVVWDELSPNEAAVVVGQSPVAFRVRLHRAKRRLRRLLETHELAPDNTFGLWPEEG
jgi:RNA polymerase sigma-70 factor (ECF subfamily)